MPHSISELQAAVNRRWHGAAVTIGRPQVDPGTVLSVGAELEAAVGQAGIPQGRLTEVLGGPSSGKTSLALAALAACTSAGSIGAYVDPGGTFFAPAAAGAGIQLQRLLVVRPSNLDVARRAVDALVRCGACSVVVFDCADAGDVRTARVTAARS